MYDQGVPMVLSPPGMGVIESMVSDIKYRAQLIARNQKLESGVSATSIIGFAIGFTFAILMIMLPILIGGI
ncbi:MAG: tetrahydromethanopterin S-methyltransferase subunit F [Methanosarcinales archaeon]